MSDNYILIENLKSALHLAVERLEQMGLSNSCACQAYRDNLAGLERGETLWIKYEN